jgi:hypothetical protein
LAENTKIKIDFTGVESGGGFVHIPEGDYGFKVTKVKQKVGEDSGKPYLLFSLKAIKGNKKGLNKTIPHNCSLKQAALWNLRNLLEAAGKQVPSKAIVIDITKLVGLEVGATVVDDEYDGKKKSVVAAFFPLSELVEAGDEETEETGEEETEEVEEEEEEKPKGKKKVAEPAKPAGKKKGKGKSEEELEEGTEEATEEEEEETADEETEELFE